MGQVTLYGGKVAIVDDCDLLLVSGYSWYETKKGYAETHIGNQKVFMHTLIAQSMGLVGQIDHRDQTPLNNRRSNLRVATNSQNHANKSKQAGTYTSKYKGVSWQGDRGMWKARIHVQGKEIFLGRFLQEEAAATAYNVAAIKYFGEFAALNVLE